MYLKKFGSGKKGKCIKILVDKTSGGTTTGDVEKEEKWLTPIEFEAFSGKSNCRDWKRTIKVGGQQLITLFDSKILLCHAVSCSCAICQNDSSVVGPIRPFVKYRRRRKDEIQAQNAYKNFLRLKPPTFPPALMNLKNLNNSEVKEKPKTSSVQAKSPKNHNSHNSHHNFENTNSTHINKSVQLNPTKLPKMSKLISEVAQQMANVEENTWEPLEQVCSIELKLLYKKNRSCIKIFILIK